MKRGLIVTITILLILLLVSFPVLSQEDEDYFNDEEDGETQEEKDYSSGELNDEDYKNGNAYPEILNNDNVDMSEVPADRASNNWETIRTNDDLRSSMTSSQKKEVLTSNYNLQETPSDLSGASINTGSGGDTLNIGDSSISLESGNQVSVTENANGGLDFNDGSGNKCNGCEGITYTSGGELSGTNDDNTDDEGDGGFLGGLDKVSQANSLNTGLFSSECCVFF